MCDKLCNDVLFILYYKYYMIWLNENDRMFEMSWMKKVAMMDVYFCEFGLYIGIYLIVDVMMIILFINVCICELWLWCCEYWCFDDECECLN